MADRQNKRNILVEFLGKNGAGTVFTLEIAKALENNGMNVWVILSDEILNRNEWESIKNPKIHIRFIHTGNRRTIISSTMKFMVSKNKLFAGLKNVSFDYALRTFPHPWMELIECELNIERVFYILHDPIPHTGTEHFRKIISRRNAKTADDIIVLSKKYLSIVPTVYKIPRANVHYMRHGLLSVADSKEASTIQRKQLDTYDSVFVFFGRIDKYKGLHVLAAAYREVKVKSKNIALVIAGSGDFSEYRDDYKGLEDIFIYNKYLNDKEITDLFTLKNSIIVLPYLDATQSGVITIAAEFKRPIIASDSGALREQLLDGDVGIFCKPGNVTDLAASMNVMITDKAVFNHEVKKMDMFKKYLSWDTSIKKFFDDLND